MNDILIDLLRTVSSSFQQRLQEMSAIEEFALAPFQARLLSLIGRRQGISQNSLATATERDKAQVARAIKELAKRNLIVRKYHETDWRTQCLQLTDEGRSIAIQIDQQRAELIDRALQYCTNEEQEYLCRVLEKIWRSMSS